MLNRNAGNNDLIESIFDLHRSIMNIYFKDFEDTYGLPDGLNPTHMKAILLLMFHGDMAMTELSRMLSLEKGSFTTVADRLVKRGLVKKERSAEDKRVYHLVLTNPGREMAARFKEDHWDFITRRLERLSPEEQEDYFSMIEALNRYNGRIRGC